MLMGICHSETFLGYGTADVTLFNCQAKERETIRWSIGETYNITEISCPPVDVQIKPHIILL
jgi:hypothetical protein